METAKLWKIRGKSSWDNISRGKYFNENPIWIRYFIEPQDKQVPVKLGFAISKKYGNAVKRNRFKRRTREIVRELSRNNSFPNGIILLVGTAKKNEKEVTFNETKTCFLAFVSSLK